MKDHGTWSRYKPIDPPENFPANALYAKRDSDGTDWYNYVRSNVFEKNSIKLSVRVWTDGGLPTISAPQLDASHLFPVDHRVIEIEGDYSNLDEEARIKRFAGKIIDLKTGKISDPPIREPEPETPKVITDILKRLAKLESRKLPHNIHRILD